jgi:hypothetical protein
MSNHTDTTRTVMEMVGSLCLVMEPDQHLLTLKEVNHVRTHEMGTIYALESVEGTG